MNTSKITLQEIYRHSEGTESVNHFNPLSQKYEAFNSISIACAFAKGKRLIADSTKTYLTNISIVRHYENGTLVKQLIFSH
jgi:hypothetical protein